MSGPYGREAYVRSLCPDQAEVVALWGGHVLLRPMPQSADLDAASAYPLGGFAAAADIEAGLAALTDRGAVALAVVPDPLNVPDGEELHRRACVRRHLKTHYLVDLEGAAFAPSRHHRQEIRRAARRCTVEEVRLESVMGEWLELYGGLRERHGIGLGAGLPRAHFEWLARDPQAMTLAARIDGTVAALSIWLSDGEIAHNHLGASSADGYRIGASYALYAAAIERLSGHRVLDLGGMPGLVDDPGHGLARFKRGFANAERSSVLIGFVLDRERYERATGRRVGAGDPGYFPAYRVPESPAE